MGCGIGSWYGSHGRQPWKLNESINVTSWNSRTKTSLLREKKRELSENFFDIFLAFEVPFLTYI